MKRSGLVLAGIVVVGVCAASVPPNFGQAVPGSAPVVPIPPPSSNRPVQLVAYDSCDKALSEFRRAARPNVGPYGAAVSLTDMGQPIPEGSIATDSRGEKPAAAPQQPPGAPAPTHSTTNVQEAGVDEPDLVKTDGKRIVSIADGRLRVVDVASRTVTGTLELPNASASQLLLHGDRALVVTTSMMMAKPLLPNDYQVGGASFVLVDLSGAPKSLGTLTVDGMYVDARQIGGVARVVVSSQPRLQYVLPGDRTEPQALQENLRILDTAPIDAWLPRYELTTPTSRSDGTLVDCSRISYPEEHTATSLLTVLTLDLAGALGTGDPVSIVATGSTVYGTDANLYVADRRRVASISPTDRMPPLTPATTAIHQFDISQPGPPKHVASGVVSGTPLNQYALSEHNGHLRIATTDENVSAVTVFKQQGDTLVQTGRVDGLGVGERIYSVRFLGAVGYVVTFKQTDPLYTLDLADPAKPRVVGELKITGYSAYLHPAGDGRLIGVGQEATDRGRTTGVQVSLFDVHDAAAPRRIAQHLLPDVHSEAEYDAHAFLYWPATGLLALPVFGQGSLVLRLGDNGFTSLGTVQGDDIRRAIVIGNELWTVSATGMRVNSTDRVAQLAWVPFS